MDRARCNAADALGCFECKPEWDGVLPTATLAKLTQIAESDSSAKVQAEATRALSGQT